MQLWDYISQFWQFFPELQVYISWATINHIQNKSFCVHNVYKVRIVREKVSIIFYIFIL